MKALSTEAVTRFADQGYLCPVPALSADETAHYLRCLETLEAAEGGPLAGPARNNTHLRLGWAAALARHPAILDAVEDLLGSDILLFFTQWFVKEPHTADFVSYHQDSSYWTLGPDQGVSSWVALVDCDLENGCMQVVPGSHARGRLGYVEVPEPRNMLARGTTVEGSIDPQNAVPMILKAGQMSLHHAHTVHGSGPNHSDRRRIGFAARFVPAATRGARHKSICVRGYDIGDRSALRRGWRRTLRSLHRAING